jgi:hypothetical protein
VGTFSTSDVPALFMKLKEELTEHKQYAFSQRSEEIVSSTCLVSFDPKIGPEVWTLGTPVLGLTQSREYN